MKKFFASVLLVLTALTLMIAPALAAIKVQVSDTAYESKWLTGTYPTVKLKNAAVAERINADIKAEIERFAAKLRGNYWLHRDQTGQVSYRVVCNKADTLSLILDESQKVKTGRKVWAKALTYKTQTGQRVNYDDVWRIVSALDKTKNFDRAGLTELLYEQTRRAGVALFEPFPGVPYPPEDIYLDNKLRFHLIFQPGVVAPEATGPIDIDIDEENW